MQKNKASSSSSSSSKAMKSVPTIEKIISVIKEAGTTEGTTIKKFDYHDIQELSSATDCDGAPITQKRRVPNKLNRINEPGIPRACAAATNDMPKGTIDDAFIGKSRNRHNKVKSVLQMHCDFFDLNGDDILTVSETYIGFRKLGFHIITSLIACILIHVSLSYATQDSWIPDPFLRIYLKNIHRGKHGSDTGTYDSEGRFVPEKFEEIFSKYDKQDRGGLNWKELIWMLMGNRCLWDPVGWTAAMAEWGFLWSIAADRSSGVIWKEDIRASYDGSLFYRIASQHEKHVIANDDQISRSWSAKSNVASRSALTKARPGTIRTAFGAHAPPSA